MEKNLTKIKVQVEKTDDGVYWGTTQNIPGVVTADGRTLNELKANITEAIELYLEVAQDIDKKEILELFSNGIKLEYKLELSNLFVQLKVLNKSAFATRIGVSSGLMRQYASNKNIYISEERARKIEEGLHQLGEELQAVKL